MTEQVAEAPTEASALARPQVERPRRVGLFSSSMDMCHSMASYGENQLLSARFSIYR